MYEKGKREAEKGAEVCCGMIGTPPPALTGLWRNASLRDTPRHLNSLLVTNHVPQP